QKKLLILDCCYSGSVFRVEQGWMDHGAEDKRSDEISSSGRIFQVITAGRGYQEGSDGRKGGNSPFTAALLLGMSALAQQKADRSFSSTELFKTVEAQVFDTMKGVQTPQCRRLDHDGDRAAEFVFKAPADANFPESKFYEDSPQILMA